ncbi:MAG: hypothetical protein RR893_00195 [Clostridia bacterium]
MIKRAARIHLPPGGLLMVTVVALLFMLLPFRMPPLSRSKSLVYYAVDGTKTAQTLNETPSPMKMTLSGNGNVVCVDAAVRLPENAHVAVYQGVAYMPDAARIQAVFFSDECAFDKEVTSLQTTYAFYNLTVASYTCDEGYFDLCEDGRVTIGLFNSSIPIGNADDARSLLVKAGFPVETADIAYDEAVGGYAITTQIDGLPLSAYPAHDYFTEKPTDGVHMIVLVKDGLLDGIQGSVWTAAETLWESTSIRPLAQSLKGLETGLYTSGQYDAIRMAYHGRLVYAKPREVLFYPIWELTNSENPEEITILNAITGYPELFLMD